MKKIFFLLVPISTLIAMQKLTIIQNNRQQKIIKIAREYYDKEAFSVTQRLAHPRYVMLLALDYLNTATKINKTIYHRLNHLYRANNPNSWQAAPWQESEYEIAMKKELWDTLWPLIIFKLDIVIFGSHLSQKEKEHFSSEIDLGIDTIFTYLSRQT